MINRKTFFDAVRLKPFGGRLTQAQVDGMNIILERWESRSPTGDPRHLAYMLATTFHETARTMQPIEEYGKGLGHPYGSPDPETKQTYYGRGFIQLTWKANYARATKELSLTGADDLVMHASRALDPGIAADVMFRGMAEGWFRAGHTLSKYFDSDTNDAYNAREIINGDKARVPSWSHGVSIGNLCKQYHEDFLAALKVATGEQKIVTIYVRVESSDPDIVVNVVREGDRT